jgi:hypothetical protein
LVARNTDGDVAVSDRRRPHLLNRDDAVASD